MPALSREDKTFEVFPTARLTKNLKITDSEKKRSSASYPNPCRQVSFIPECFLTARELARREECINFAP